MPSMNRQKKERMKERIINLTMNRDEEKTRENVVQKTNQRHYI